MVNHRCIRFMMALLLGILVVIMGPADRLWAGPQPDPLAKPGAAQVIPISEQLFYPELLAAAARWTDAPLGQVVGESPRETLINFYAVMAVVNQEIDNLTHQDQSDPGLLWSPKARKHIESANQLFDLAVQALDASTFPESVRIDMANEAAIQLKEVLDFVLTHSTQPIAIPDSKELERLNSDPKQSWTLLDTAITLIREKEAIDGNPGYVFSPGTVSQIGRMYNQVIAQPVVDQPFASPGFYHQYSYTPGALVPPKWYLRLPPYTRRFLELAFQGQTLLQIVAALFTLLLYGWLLSLITLKLLDSYRVDQNDRSGSLRRSNLSWYRVLLVLPVLPLTRISHVFIDDYVSFTDMPLVVVTYLFFIANFIAASFFFYFLLEALGGSLAQGLARLRGGGSDLQLRRVNNLVMPMIRVCEGLVVLVLVYRLLMVLGLPSSTVLAFSAVPGLAIGLGASKLLGNLFAGLSIQSDRPLRVGDFCRISDNLGFVTKIGLRSLELQTLESRITIPNAIADEQTIVNFSRHSRNSSAVPMQSLDVRLLIEESLSPEQVDDLLHLVRSHVAGVPELLDPLVSFEQSQENQLTLICFVMVLLHDWPTYLKLREQLLVRLQQLLYQVRRSRIEIGVSYDTSADQLERLPELIRQVVNSDPDFDMRSCRLMEIADSSFIIVMRLHGSQNSLRKFKDGIHALNLRLLHCFASEGIETSLPTQLQLQRQA